MKTTKKINDQGYSLEWRMGTKWNEKSFGWYLECKKCGEPTRVGSDEVAAVTCYKCVSKEVNQPIDSDDND
jgi:ribosomal protein S27E